MGWDGMGWDGMGWDGMGWDGMGWDGMGWDGMGWEEIKSTQVKSGQAKFSHVKSEGSPLEAGFVESNRIGREEEEGEVDDRDPRTHGEQRKEPNEGDVPAAAHTRTQCSATVSEECSTTSAAIVSE
jgi:hypothetical protein